MENVKKQKKAHNHSYLLASTTTVMMLMTLSRLIHIVDVGIGTTVANTITFMRQNK